MSYTVNNLKSSLMVKTAVLCLKRKKKKFECLTCKKKFGSKSGFNNHKKIHDKIFQCKVCLKCFQSEAKLYDHNRIHTGEKPYMCCICQHKKIHHKSNPLLYSLYIH